MQARLTSDLQTPVGMLVAGQWVTVIGYTVTVAPSGDIVPPAAMTVRVDAADLEIPNRPYREHFRIPMKVFADLYLNAPLEVQNRTDAAIGTSRVDRTIRVFDKLRTVG